MTLEEALAEIERLRSLTRFYENVIRSGDVACLTEAERATLHHYATNNTHQRGDVLRGLLERLGGERGNSLVFPDSSLADAEREAVEAAVAEFSGLADEHGSSRDAARAATLRGLLDRTPIKPLPPNADDETRRRAYTPAPTSRPPHTRQRLRAAGGEQ